MKKIVIGISGSIAAFKSVQFISDLLKEGFDLEVILTEAAAKFVSPVTIQALTKKKVYVDVFDDEPGMITHIDLVKDADLFMIVPASANTIAKVANGIADNMLTASFLAATCPKLIAPAMNTHMLENKATQRNIQTLKEDGVYFAQSDVGLLACGVVGKGKLTDYTSLRLMMDYAMSDHALAGKSVLVTAGPTQEAMDPVRFISNHSSGKMGYAIARAAFVLGAKVHLLSGPVALAQPPYVSFESFTSALELEKLMLKEAPFFDYIIMAAAVGDYRAASIATEKIKKQGDTLTITFQKNPDILAELGKNKQSHQVICGFAMETENLLENAKEKLLKKNADMIIANSLKTAGAGFQGDTNIITMITKEAIEPIEKKSKEELGYLILRKCMKLEEHTC